MPEITLREAREKSGLSLRKAAELLKITHPYLSGLELGHKPLLPDRARELVKLYKLPPSYSLVQPIPQDKEEFIEWLRNQIRMWDSRFVLPMMPAVTLPIAELFVDPYFIDEENNHIKKSILLKSFLTDKENTALVIKGNMGTGKSLFLRMLTLESDRVCDELGLSNHYVPILISLGEFRFQQGAPLLSIVNYYQQHGFTGSLLQLERFFRQCIDRGSALLLFDGLDEIHGHNRRVETLARLQHYFESELRRGGNRMIVTGREDSFFERDRAYNGFRVIEIARWRADQMHTACQKWSFASENESARFFNVIQVNENVYNLARWPLLFHLLTTLYSTSGLKPFLERSGLYDACCQSLENTWDSARRTFQRAEFGEAIDPLAAHPWLKWRHFLIHLMQRVIELKLNKGNGLKLSFTPGEMRDAWESFLSGKGVERQSLDFARLEDLISNQNRIGPMYHQRIIRNDSDGPRILDQYSFIDSVFAVYYYAKALINRISDLESFISENLRKSDWAGVISLAVEELGRSDRSYENQLGEKLISLMLSLDDSIGIEKKHKFGHYGLFGAVRCAHAYSMDRYWDTVFEPFLSIYMNSMFEADGTMGNVILGEFSASNRLRDYFLKLFNELVESEDPSKLCRDERKWRVLAALGRFGEKGDFIADELLRDINDLVKRGTAATIDDKIDMRRLMWSLRQLGRVLIQEGDRSLQDPKSKRARIEKIQDALNRFVSFVLEEFDREMKTQKFSKVSYWDCLTVVLETESFLQYHATLRRTVNDITKMLIAHIDIALDKYPHRHGVIQFLKGLGCVSNLLSPEMREALRSKINQIGASSDDHSSAEFRVISWLFELQSDTFKKEADMIDQFGQVFGENTKDYIEKWMNVLKLEAQGKTQCFSQIGMAVTGLSVHFRDDLKVKGVDSRVKVIELLLKVLDKELSLKVDEKDAERIYTAPFSMYCYPLYDHIYNCIVSLGRGLPLVPVTAGGL